MNRIAPAFQNGLVRIVFFGTGDFAVPALEALGNSVIEVVTQPDRPSGRGMKLRPSPVKAAATAREIPVSAPERARSAEFVAHLRELEPDVLIVAAYGQILSQELLDVAPRGGINLHGSILPAYRGAAPIQRAILAGETETGVTLMQMDRGMDSGDIIAIERTPIGPEETYGELQGRLSNIAADMLLRWLPALERGDYARTPQDGSLATLAPKIGKEDAELSWNASAIENFRRYRATSPNPGAFFLAGQDQAGPNQTVRVIRAAYSEQTGPIGTILAVKPFPLVAFEGGSIQLLEVRPEGKKAMSGADWANGWRLRAGQTIKHG